MLLVIATALAVIGIMAFGIAVPRIQPIDWSLAEPARLTGALRHQAS